MSKRRNKSGGPLDVPLLGTVVEAGEVAECPDFQPAHNPGSKPGDADYLPIEWPPDKWVLVPDPVIDPELPKRAKAAQPKALPDPDPEPEPEPLAPGNEPATRPVSSDPRER